MTALTTTKRLGLVVIIFSCTFVACTKSPDQALYALCQESVVAQLKTPATAKFPDTAKDVWRATHGSAAYLRGYVDAQNAYGALIRTNFVCGRDLGRFQGIHAILDREVRLSRSDEQWRDQLLWTELQYEYVKAQTEELRARPGPSAILAKHEEMLKQVESIYQLVKSMASIEERRAKGP